MNIILKILLLVKHLLVLLKNLICSFLFLKKIEIFIIIIITLLNIYND